MLIWLALLWCAGCGAADSANSARPTIGGVTSNPPGEAAALTAGDLLRRLLWTYRNTQTYRDDAVLRLRFTQAGRTVEDQWKTAVAWKKPNQLALQAYQAEVKIDGGGFFAQIRDPESRDLDGQVVVRPAPAQLKLADLAADPLLYDTLSSQLRRQPIQLELLLESRGLASAFASDLACRLLADDRQDGAVCRRVEVPSPAGPFVFWIDPAGFVLRRLDYPAAALLPQLAADPAIERLELWADLAGARLNAELPASTFEFSVPAAAKRMKTFVRPPLPLPSPLFGKEPGDFYFTTLDDKRLTSDNLKGKVAVLCWYYDHPACEATLQQVELARREFALHPHTSFYAVSSDPSSVAGEQLEARRNQWKFELPIVRDWEAYGDKLFRITLQPTLVVLDPAGRVQIFQVGGDAELGKRLTVIIDRLLKGEDIAAEIQKRAAEERSAYDQLVARGGPDPAPVTELPEAAIRRASRPQALQLEPLWTCRELKSPGNLVLVPSAGQPGAVLVCDGWRSIARLDAAGRVLRKYEPALPEGAAITFLRTTETPRGRIFCASSPLAPQCFVLDEQLALTHTLPPTGEESLQIADLQFLDRGSAAPLQLAVASLGLAGVRAYGLDGALAWKNRAAPSAVSLALAPGSEAASPALLALSDQGAVVPLTELGRDLPPLPRTQRTLLRLVRGDFASAAKQAPLLGIAADPTGKVVAVGLTADLQESWTYELPPGGHARPIEAVASARDLAGLGGVWVLAGADGSVHLVSEDGRFHDSFAVGAVLSGIVAGRLAGQDVLIVSTDDGVEAWRVSR